MIQHALEAYEYALKSAEERHRGYERHPYGWKPFYPSEDALYNFFVEYLEDIGYSEDEIDDMWQSSEVQSSLTVDQEIAHQDNAKNDDTEDNDNYGY